MTVYDLNRPIEANSPSGLTVVRIRRARWATASPCSAASRRHFAVSAYYKETGRPSIDPEVLLRIRLLGVPPGQPGRRPLQIVPHQRHGLRAVPLGGADHPTDFPSLAVD